MTNTDTLLQRLREADESPAVEVDYIDSGAFQGGECDVSMAGIRHGETCRVLRQPVLDALLDMLAEAKGALEELTKNGISADEAEACYCSSDATAALAKLDDLAGRALGEVGR